MTISVWGWGATSITTWGYGICCEDYVPVLVCTYLGGGAWSCVVDREGDVDIRSQTSDAFLRLKGVPGQRLKPSEVTERSQGWPWQSGEICYTR